MSILKVSRNQGKGQLCYADIGDNAERKMAEKWRYCV